MESSGQRLGWIWVRFIPWHVQPYIEWWKKRFHTLRWMNFNLLSLNLFRVTHCRGAIDTHCAYLGHDQRENCWAVPSPWIPAPAPSVACLPRHSPHLSSSKRPQLSPNTAMNNYLAYIENKNDSVKTLPRPFRTFAWSFLWWLLSLLLEFKLVITLTKKCFDIW